MSHHTCANASKAYQCTIPMGLHDVSAGCPTGSASATCSTALQSQLDTSSTGAAASSLMSFTSASGPPVPPHMMELLLSSMLAGGRSSVGTASPTVTPQGLPVTVAGCTHLPSLPGNQVGIEVGLSVRASVRIVQGVVDPRKVPSSV